MVIRRRQYRRPAPARAPVATRRRRRSPRPRTTLPIDTPGEPVRFPRADRPRGARAYLAVPGGIGVPLPGAGGVSGEAAADCGEEELA
ncbi:hypothetical protein GCM10018772_04400 [Streptomyces fumanus]|uniref:Uncharacterized protein n=1 Tax=Streptomyces fumanus TaxID=67302 RepID=A0A919A544_9ACTN|nr:hypothetical protein GCM10018772_04400 [Streptomyces fumanus]